jgi:hypothetical protein
LDDFDRRQLTRDHCRGRYQASCNAAQVAPRPHMLTQHFKAAYHDDDVMRHVNKYCLEYLQIYTRGLLCVLSCDKRYIPKLELFYFILK